MTRAPQRRLADLIDDITELAAQGLTREQIAARLGYSSRDAVDKAITRYRRNGLPTYAHPHRFRPIRHGTRHAYDRRGCRCDDCRACNAERSRRQRAYKQVAA